MIKRFFLLISMLVVSLFVFSENSIGMQTLLTERGEQFLSRSFHRASICHLSTKRFFSSTSLHDDISFLEGSKKRQVFSRPTCDRIAKHILSQDESVRVDILRAFTEINTLSSAKQLDEHHNPFDPFHNLRKLINYSSQNFFETIRGSSTIELFIDGKENKQASEILKRFSRVYDDLSYAFPINNYRSTVDFLCETAFGYITIEFEVATQDYWDKRALAHIASLYGNQIRSRKNYDLIHSVIGINFLGDGSAPYWKDGNFMRDYTFMDQRGSKRKIPSLRLIQYSLGDVDFNHPDLKENKQLSQWIEFFKSAHEKESMPSSIDEPVRKAYEMIKVDTLKKEHPDLLKASDEFFSSLMEHDQAVKEKGIEEGRKKETQDFVKRFIQEGMEIEKIVELSGVDEKEVLELKNQGVNKE